MNNLTPAYMTINEFSKWCGLGRTKIYELMGDEIKAVKAGGRRLICVESAKVWLANQPEYVKGAQ